MTGPLFLVDTFETRAGNAMLNNHSTTVETPVGKGLDAPNRLSTSVTYSCGGCDNRWPGVSRAHCAACHRTFGGFGLFDQHRRDVRGQGTCLDPETIFREVGEDKQQVRVMHLTDGLWQSTEAPAKRVGPRKRVSSV